MARPAKTPVLSFDDAMTIHVLRAHGLTYRELERVVGDHPTRMSKVLNGTLHEGSWDEAVERLSRGQCWHPTVADLVGQHGTERIISTIRSADPRRRRYNQRLKQLRKGQIPFVR
jgi:hypothetical protein